jgi:hypothetical protein
MFTLLFISLGPCERPSIAPDVPGRAPVTDAEFMARFAAAASSPLDPPVPARPLNLADGMRAMGLM